MISLYGVRFFCASGGSNMALFPRQTSFRSHTAGSKSAVPAACSAASKRACSRSSAAVTGLYLLAALDAEPPWGLPGAICGAGTAPGPFWRAFRDGEGSRCC